MGGAMRGATRGGGSVMTNQNSQRISCAHIER